MAQPPHSNSGSPAGAPSNIPPDRQQTDIVRLGEMVDSQHRASLDQASGLTKADQRQQRHAEKVQRKVQRQAEKAARKERKAVLRGPRKSKWSLVWAGFKTFLWFVIAVALVKLAFFPGSDADAAQSMAPSVNFTQITTTPTTGTISNTMKLAGTIQADAASALRAVAEGEITALWAKNGDQVQAGQQILLIQREVPGEEIVTVDEEGNEQVDVGDSTWTWDVVSAPATGTLNLQSLLNQQVSVGDTLGSVQPPTFHVVADLSADQMYRLGEPPESANVAINNGPAPFDCAGLKVVTPQVGQTNTDDTGVGIDDTGSTSTSTGVRAICSVPTDQQVFPGLQVTMTITAGEAADVLTLPISAVEGRYQKGNVYVPTDDPLNPEKVEVELGITDGMSIEIKGGLSPDQEVLEFVPGVPQDMDSYNCDPMTGEGC